MHRRVLWFGAGVFAIACASMLVPGSDSWAGSKLRPPPDVTLHPDRGMTFTRFSKTSHDQRVFKALNQGTRLPLMDPAIDPYNLNMKSSVYEPQSGQIRGSLTDAYRSIRRAQDASRRANRQPRTTTTSRRTSGEAAASD